MLLNRKFPQGLNSIGRFLMIAYVLSASLFLVIANGYWKNNYMMGSILVETFPDFYKGHVVLGVELLKGWQIDDAIIHFEKALKDPRCNDPLAWHGLAYAYKAAGRSIESDRMVAELNRLFPWYTPELFEP
jgi:tetratricopeptide (TPR) repeat protein